MFIIEVYYKSFGLLQGLSSQCPKSYWVPGTVAAKLSWQLLILLFFEKTRILLAWVIQDTPWKKKKRFHFHKHLGNTTSNTLPLAGLQLILWHIKSLENSFAKLTLALPNPRFQKLIWYRTPFEHISYYHLALIFKKYLMEQRWYFDIIVKFFVGTTVLPLPSLFLIFGFYFERQSW